MAPSHIRKEPETTHASVSASYPHPEIQHDGLPNQHLHSKSDWMSKLVTFHL